jgi:hypothetical protein
MSIMLMDIKITNDDKQEKYTRQVDDLLSFIGTLGGLYDILTRIGGIFVGYITEKLYKSKIVKKVYHYRKKPKRSNSADHDKTDRVKEIKEHEAKMSQEMRDKKVIDNEDIKNMT